ncbi:hypothetical protein R1sor_020717 [Riccia sorocarpa]|uniref:Bet v I/Major latex protein domain-containing protein n=1 Tax=Riccia sorocarpa TaxID=122646 RepID=A0ABD3GGN5_9MARC
MPIYEYDLDAAAPAASIWGAIERETELFPKYAPEWFKSFEFHEGAAGKPGSVFTIHFGEKFKTSKWKKAEWAKCKLITFDAEKRTVALELLDGGILHEHPSMHRFTHTYSVKETEEVMKLWLEVYLTHIENERK